MKLTSYTQLIECKMVQLLWKTVCKVLKKIKIELPHDPKISLLNIYPKESVRSSKRYLHSQVHCSIIHNNLNAYQRWMNKENTVITYIRISFNHKMKEILSNATWMNLEDTVLSEISRLQKLKYCMILLIWSS